MLASSCLCDDFLSSPGHAKTCALGRSQVRTRVKQPALVLAANQISRMLSRKQYVSACQAQQRVLNGSRRHLRDATSENIGSSTSGHTLPDHRDGTSENIETSSHQPPPPRRTPSHAFSHPFTPHTLPHLLSLLTSSHTFTHFLTPSHAHTPSHPPTPSHTLSHPLTPSHTFSILSHLLTLSHILSLPLTPSHTTTSRPCPHEGVAFLKRKNKVFMSRLHKCTVLDETDAPNICYVARRETAFN